ncbi:MAG: recombinase [Bacilli bacterium]|nr:recombinase [Bacilli bacterium]
MDYDKKMEKIIKTNEKYLDEFEKWLENKKLNPKTINRHVSNAYLYINDYLNYYEFCKMEDGCRCIDGFLGDWFVRKCLWSTASSVKSTAASIKKFYQCMNELGYVDKSDYSMLCDEIKDSMEFWIENVEEYNSGDFDYYGIF